MIKNLIIIKICLLICLQTFGQRNPCSITPGYINLKNNEERKEITNIKKGEVLLSFFGDFDNDTISVYQNKKLVKTLILKTNMNTGHTDQSVVVNKKRKHDILKIINIGSKSCFEMPIQSGYKSIQIAYTNREWKVSYSNYVPQLE